MKIKTFFQTICLFLAVLVLVAGGGAGCNKEDPNNLGDSYTGAWQISFDGTCVNSKTVIINRDGSFQFSVSCGVTPFIVEGQVDFATGKVTGSAHSNAFIWPIGCEDALSGHINLNGAGSGIYECQSFAISGGWTAFKKA